MNIGVIDMTGDPIKDYYDDDFKKAEWLESRPICSECDEPIQDDIAYEIDNKLYCEHCLDQYHKIHLD